MISERKCWQGNGNGFIITMSKHDSMWRPLQMWLRKLPLHLQPRACSHHSRLKWEHRWSQNSFHYQTFSFQLGCLHLAISKRCSAELWSLSENFADAAFFRHVGHYHHGVLGRHWEGSKLSPPPPAEEFGPHGPGHARKLCSSILILDRSL